MFDWTQLTDLLRNHEHWGPLLVIAFMAMESSILPVPSEFVMPPAGFMAAHSDFFPSESPILALIVAILCGTIGSVLGAYANYVVSMFVGRPFLHRWGKYFFLPPHKLERAEELFREYGDVSTFVCRLIPVARHLISIPAGLSKMNFRRFTFFTATGAAIWCTILAVIGYSFGWKYRDQDYSVLGPKMIQAAKDNVVWIVLACVVIFAVYAWVHYKVMHGKKPSPPPSAN